MQAHTVLVRYLLQYRGNDSEHAGFRSISKFGIPRYLQGVNIDGLTTCCWYSYDKPSRMPGDVILVSSNVNAKDPNLEGEPFTSIVDFEETLLSSLKVKGGLSSNESYEPKLEKLEYNELAELSKKINLPSSGMYSDHIPTSRLVEGIQMVTFNASFVILKMQARFVNHLPTLLLEGVGGATHGSEGLAAMAIARQIVANVTKDLPFPRFVNNVLRPLDSGVVLIQEWLSPNKYRGGDFEGNEFICNVLITNGYKTFQTHSGFEGSCIAYKENKATPIVSDELCAKLNETGFWSWCGIEGRTWSVIRCEGDRPFLCMNVHGPNIGPDGKPKKTVGPFYSKMNEYFGVAWFTKNTIDYNRFKSDIRTAHQIFLDCLLEEEVPRDVKEPDSQAIVSIRDAYKKCEKRLVVGGDWNDAFMKVDNALDGFYARQLQDPSVTRTTRL